MLLFTLPEVATDAIGVFTSSYGTIHALVVSHTYVAVFALMVLEGSSLPVPSEIVIPLAGILSKQGMMQLPLAFIAVLAGSIIGLAVDYYIGYYLEKDVVYKNLNLFHLTKERLDLFDAWFNRNGTFAVFISRLIPVLRTVISFPAGFAKMPKGKFFTFSILGTAIWDMTLLLFGYYLLSAQSAAFILTAFAVFLAAIYIIYRIAMDRIDKKKKSRAK